MSEAPRWEPCSEGCEGYFASHCDGHGHAPVEIQACHDCGRFVARGGGVDDDAAAIHFVRQLEKGDRYAVRQLVTLLFGSEEGLEDVLAVDPDEFYRVTCDEWENRS